VDSGRGLGYFGWWLRSELWHWALTGLVCRVVHGGEHGCQLGIVSGASNVAGIWWFCGGKLALPGVPENVVEGYCIQIFLICSKGSRTGRSEDKKPPPLNNSEDKKMSLLWGGRERESGTSSYVAPSIKSPDHDIFVPPLVQPPHRNDWLGTPYTPSPHVWLRWRKAVH
jgi:hypothetical protein